MNERDGSVIAGGRLPVAVPPPVAAPLPAAAQHDANVAPPLPAAEPLPVAPHPVLLHETTLGEAWLGAAELVLREGRAARWGRDATREIGLLTIAVDEPDPDDALIARLGDPAWLAWMRANFREPGAVAELGGADSYARRLRDYAGTGRDQVGWLIARLAADPGARDATITTFQPGTDTTYIPCVSVIDAWAPDGRLQLVAYAHSLDLGKKAYGNFVELAALQREIASGTGLPTGGLVIHVKTAHIYEPELEAIARLVAERADPPAR